MIVSDEEVTSRDVTQTDAAIENCFEFIRNDEMMVCTVSQRRLITKILKLREKFPDEVIVSKMPEDNEGYLVCKMPVSYLHLSHYEVSEDRKKAAKERMQKMQADGKMRRKK